MRKKRFKNNCFQKNLWHDKRPPALIPGDLEMSEATLRPEYHSLAGNAPLSKGRPNVYLLHEGGNEVGCGARDHFNKEHAEHAINELWDGLEKLGATPKTFFGMTKEQLLKQTLDMQVPHKLGTQATSILEQARAENANVIVGSFNHVTGTITLIGSHGKANGEPHYSICSDARVPEAAAEKFFQAVKSKQLTNGNSIEAREFTAPTPTVQAPSEILVYPPSQKPNKKSGKTFSVSTEGELSPHHLLSLAYAIVNFGPHGNRALKTIRVTDANVAINLTTRLANMNGIAIKKS